PRAAACTGDGQQAGAGKEQGGEGADAGHSGVLGRGLPARSDRRARRSRRRVATDPFPNARIACTMRAPLRSGPPREAPGGTEEGLHTVLTFFETALECAAPSTGTPVRLNGKGSAEINPTLGVDGSQSRAIMGGSLGKKCEG